MAAAVAIGTVAAATMAAGAAMAVAATIITESRPAGRCGIMAA